MSDLKWSRERGGPLLVACLAKEIRQWKKKRITVLALSRDLLTYAIGSLSSKLYSDDSDLLQRLLSPDLGR